MGKGPVASPCTPCWLSSQEDYMGKYILQMTLTLKMGQGRGNGIFWLAKISQGAFYV